MLRIRRGPASIRSTLSRVSAALNACPQASSPRFLRLQSTLPTRNPLFPRASKSPSLSSQWRPSPVRLGRNVRHNSGKATAPEGGSPPPPPPPPQGLSARFRELSRKYGWAAVGVYMGLSVLDFPFCFLAVRLIGPERIGEVEHAVVDGFWNIVATVVPSMQAQDRAETEVLADAEARETQAPHPHAHRDNASIWTQLLLAYGVHKSLIFFRVPLTAAVTPKVVKTLRGWGWNIGKPAKAVKSPSQPP